MAEGRERLDSARSTTMQTVEEEEGQELFSELDQEPLELRESRQLDGAEETLREAADLAARVFDAQMVIVQPT